MRKKTDNPQQYPAAIAMRKLSQSKCTTPIFCNFLDIVFHTALGELKALLQISSFSISIDVTEIFRRDLSMNTQFVLHMSLQTQFHANVVQFSRGVTVLAGSDRGTVFSSIPQSFRGTPSVLNGADSIERRAVY